MKLLPQGMRVEDGRWRTEAVEGARDSDSLSAAETNRGGECSRHVAH